MKMFQSCHKGGEQIYGGSALRTEMTLYHLRAGYVVVK